MGHKTSDGQSYRATNDSGGAVSAGDPLGIDGVFGFAEHDAAAAAEVILSIAQEEREVQYPAKAGGWAPGDLVYFDGTALIDTAQAAPWDTPIGVVSARAVDAAGGFGWMMVIAGAWAGRS